ncbi:MAG: hypothetical protein LBE76_03015 [Nitrososphaerota archaeon]|jgi:hypothetical protein|nr:hypothetical protein [Nitrososphaerota archaeon]
MTKDKEKLNQIATRVDELLITINKITEELRSISATIKLITIEHNQPTTTTPPPQQPTTTKPITTTTTNNNQIETKLRTLDDIRMSFPEDLEAKLFFEDKNDYITIKPKQFLGSDNFAKIASTVRGMSGEYISAGKDSHFRVPKKKNPN